MTADVQNVTVHRARELGNQSGRFLIIFYELKPGKGLIERVPGDAMHGIIHAELVNHPRVTEFIPRQVVEKIKADPDSLDRFFSITLKVNEDKSLKAVLNDTPRRIGPPPGQKGKK